MSADHPLAKAVQEIAEAAGMNWRAVPPATAGGQWDFAIWPKGRPCPTDEDVPSSVIYVGEQVTKGPTDAPL